VARRQVQADAFTIAMANLARRPGDAMHQSRGEAVYRSYHLSPTSNPPRALGSHSSTVRPGAGRRRKKLDVRTGFCVKRFRYHRRRRAEVAVNPETEGGRQTN